MTKPFWKEERHPDDGTVLGTVDGIAGPVALDDEETAIQAVEEEYEGGTYWYLIGAADSSEGGQAVRVDLDRDGWIALHELAGKVVARIDDFTAP